MARRCGAPTQDPPSFFNRNDRPPFIAEGTHLLARQRHDSDAARRFEARVGLDWAIDHGCRAWLEPLGSNVPDSRCGHELAGDAGVSGRISDACRVCDQHVAGFEHTLEVKRALRSHSVTQGIVGENDLETRRLAVIPFCLVMRAIGTYDTMPGRNLMPKLCCGRAGSPNAIHIHGEPIGMQRVELVEETADPECGWPIGGKNSNGCQSCLSCFPHCVCKPGHKFRIKTSDRELRPLSCHCVTGASSLN